MAASVEKLPAEAKAEGSPPGPDETERARQKAEARARALARAKARAEAAMADAAAGKAKAPQPPVQPELPPARSSKAVARELRKERGKKLLKRLGVFVLLPTLVSAAYYGFVASPQYESFAMFTIHSAELRTSGGIESLLSVATGGGGRDVLAVRDYVLSRDMLAKLDKEHGFTAHYRSPSVDFWSRLGSDTSFEDAYQYFDSKVHADFDTTSGTLTLRVRAFSADKSIELAKAVLASSEEMVNKLSERERRDRTQFAEVEVKKMEARLATARKELLALQQKHGDFNPLATASASMSLRTQLEGELAKARAEVMQLTAYMNADAPQVLAAQERVKSMSALVAQESKRLVDPKRDSGISSSFGDFEAAMVEKEFAQRAYEAALAALELSRSDAARQHRYLATIAAPSRPDEATYPRPVRGVLTVFVVSFLLMGILTLMGAAIREHAKL
jgi:capsular polysaccharide transport system permease protein